MLNMSSETMYIGFEPGLLPTMLCPLACCGHKEWTQYLCPEKGIKTLKTHMQKRYQRFIIHLLVLHLVSKSCMFQKTMNILRKHYFLCTQVDNLAYTRHIMGIQNKLGSICFMCFNVYFVFFIIL